MMRKRIINTMLLLLAVLTMSAQSSLWWIDSDYANRTIVAGGEELTIEIDISGLTPGVHVLNFRAMTNDGMQGALHRRAFVVSPEADMYEYWIDDRVGQAQVVGVDTFYVDLTGLTAGVHYLNVRPRHADGTQGAVSRRAFQVAPNIAGYQWMFSSDSLLTRVNVEPMAELTLNEEPFDIPLSDGFSDISSSTPFVFTIDSVLLVRQDTTMFTMQFFTDEGRYSDVQSTEVNICDTLRHALIELPLFGEVGMDKAEDGDYRCFRISVSDSDVYALQTTQDCRLLLYNGQNRTLEFVDSTSLSGGCELTLSTGSYYGILYDMGGTNDSTFVSFRQLNNTIATPVITHRGNIIEISCATAQTNIYYTLDGTEPNTLSTKYEGPFEVTRNCIVKAKGFQAGFIESQVDSLIVDWFKAETPTFRFAYMYDSDLTIETETDDAEIYYTLNGRMLEGADTNFGYNSLSRYSKWSVWGDNKQDAKTERSGYNGSYCLMVASKENSSFESAQAGYKFSSPLTEGDYYTIRFMARSKSGNGKLQFYCQNDTLPNTRSAADTLTIGTQFADYEVTVKIDNDKTNQFVLNFGAVADTYYIDNVLFGPVISDTTNQLRTRYEGPIELRQGVTIKAVAVKEGMKDSEPAVWDYFYEGWMNMLETYERCRMICDMVEGDPNVPLAMVYDVRMRLEDMLYRYYELRLEERFDDEELLSAADEMRSYASILETMMRGFFVEGVYYHAVDSTHAEVIAPLDYYTTYRNAIKVANEVHYNDLDFQVTSVAQGAFANSTLAAIVWNPTVALKYEDVAVINNPNLLVYVNEASLAPENVTNIVVNRVAKNIELVDADNCNFFCPEPFTAEAISYTREFRQETMIGVSRGWESIALPFDVQTILHEKQGVISPFSRNDNNKHFWLRRLSSNGLVAADKMEANVPYIISMPNSSEYPAEFNLSGRVTFSAANVTVPVTETRTLALADSTIMMASTMQRLGRSSSYYALNVGEVRGQYLEGSVFERDYREVRPFEAYIIHRSDTPAPRFVPIKELNGGTTGIESLTPSLSEGEGAWYDLNGRKLQQKPKQKGVYLRNGRKVIIR